MKKTSMKEQMFKNAMNKLGSSAVKENHMAIQKLLAASDELSQSVLLFDLITDTDTMKSLSIKDDLRIQALEDFYEIKISDKTKKILLFVLAQCAKARRKNVIEKSGLEKERIGCISVLEKMHTSLQLKHR